MVTALVELFDRPNHPVEHIGWRHAEKLYETLATSQELAQSEDLKAYYRIRMDERDLNYKAYFSEGEQNTVHFEDYHSHSTERLDVEKLKALLLTLPEIKTEIEAWSSKPA